MKVEILKGNEIAEVYGIYTGDGRCEAVISRPGTDKLVFILSTLYGCPVGCSFCDASLEYRGKISHGDLIRQYEALLERSEPPGNFSKFKIQFSRMGEPAYNRDVLEAIRTILDNNKYDPVISISTIAPLYTDKFFQELKILLKHYGSRYDFQIQFSLHSTDRKQRDTLMPAKKMSFMHLGKTGSALKQYIRRKITLNFALHSKSIIDPDKLKKHFDPEIFILKFTPVNPTASSRKSSIDTTDDSNAWNRFSHIIEKCSRAGYDVIESVGDFRENAVNSNCGQYVFDSAISREVS
ncbi:MAG: radical SAM protein [bacterium]